MGLNKQETTIELRNFLLYNKEELLDLRVHHPVIAEAIANVVVAISKKYGEAISLEEEEKLKQKNVEQKSEQKNTWGLEFLKKIKNEINAFGTQNAVNAISLQKNHIVEALLDEEYKDLFRIILVKYDNSNKNTPSKILFVNAVTELIFNAINEYNKIKPGDLVEVIDPGRGYTTHPKVENKYRGTYNQEVPKNLLAKVLGIEKLITRTDNQSVYEIEALNTSPLPSQTKAPNYFIVEGGLKKIDKVTGIYENVPTLSKQIDVDYLNTIRIQAGGKTKYTEAADLLAKERTEILKNLPTIEYQTSFNILVDTYMENPAVIPAKDLYQTTRNMFEQIINDYKTAQIPVSITVPKKPSTSSGRKAPTESATKFSEGYTMKSDNDGKLYVVTVDKNNRKSWKPAK